MDEAGTPDKISLLTVDIATYDDTGVYSCQNGLNMDDKDEIAVRIGHPGWFTYLLTSLVYRNIVI